MVTCPPQLSLAPTERATHSQTHAPRRWSDLHLSPAGQSPRQAGNGPVHGINAVLVVVLLAVVRVVVVCGGRVLVVGGRVVVLTVVEVVGGRVVVVAGSVLVVGGRVALVVVVEVVVVDVVLPGQTKRRPLSCSAVATVASRSASCRVRSRHGRHVPRALALRGFRS